MKLVLYDDYKPGLLKDESVVDISQETRSIAASARNGQELMEAIISTFDSLRPALEQALSSGKAVALSSVRLRAPLPRPGKIMMMGANMREYTRPTGAPPLPIWGFFKSPEAILDPGGTIVLPKGDFKVVHPEAELVVVIGKKGKDVPRSEAMSHVFGYTCGLDVSARYDMLQDSLLGKSNDTFSPIGPCILTADEVPDYYKLQIKSSINGMPHQDYMMDDIGHDIDECIEYFSARCTINPGDIISLGTNHAGLGPIQDGDQIDMEVEPIGHLKVSVSDPRKRTWNRGPDPTYAHHRLRDQILAGLKT